MFTVNESTCVYPTAFATITAVPLATLSVSRAIPFVTSTGAFVGTTVALGSSVATGAFVGLGARVVVGSSGVGVGVILGSTYFSTVVVEIGRFFLNVESISVSTPICDLSCSVTSNDSVTVLGSLISNFISTPFAGTSTAPVEPAEYPYTPSVKPASPFSKASLTVTSDSCTPSGTLMFTVNESTCVYPTAFATTTAVLAVRVLASYSSTIPFVISSAFTTVKLANIEKIIAIAHISATIFLFLFILFLPLSTSYKLLIYGYLRLRDFNYFSVPTLSLVLSILLILYFKIAVTSAAST